MVLAQNCLYSLFVYLSFQLPAQSWLQDFLSVCPKAAACSSSELTPGLGPCPRPPGRRSQAWLVTSPSVAS